ncbi:transglutaminase family protein [Gymnodinialimonas hymeniacidonis]|uniref:transglutaminase family protein n=1 Tax=Gymnodinialimonas hymeniacidonis TaxID=3126508 RepID=UPI0034C64706
MKLSIQHTTTYRFAAPATYGLQQLRLTPKNHNGQSVGSWQMAVQGGKVETSFTDQHRNEVTLVSLSPGATDVTITCQGNVETADNAGLIGKHAGFAPLWFYQRSTDLTSAGQGVRALIKGLREDVDEDVARLHALSARILSAVPYEIGRTQAGTTAEQALTTSAGVCQDHTHIFLAAARALGHPARYVSGYLMMNDRVHQDASHAWAEAHVTGLGWVGFDISNGISPDPRYVRVATGLDYAEAAPISGLHYGAEGEAMAVDIQVAQQ